MTMFHVQWEVDIDAETPREAAEKAFDIIRREGTTATVFDIRQHDTRRPAVRVDLLNRFSDEDETLAY